MHSFETDTAAKAFVRERVDVPLVSQMESLGDGISMRSFSLELDEGTFTNVYDLAFPVGSLQPDIELPSRLTSVYDHVTANPDIRVATGGGFFFLADRASTLPRQLGLNLSITRGQVYGLPVADREAVLTDGRNLSAEHVLSLGAMSIGGKEITWSGSLTGHDTDAKIFGNGNSIVTHVHSDATGSMRVLDETSRYTSPMHDEGMVDIGFIRRDDGVFVGVSRSAAGELDIFTHDVVVRTHERYAHGELPEMRIRTIGHHAVDGSLRGAVSVGPMLTEEDFSGHPINDDKSLGGKPPFLDVPLARTVLYEAENGIMHLRLFDGRPGSTVFPGVTPRQATEAIDYDGGAVWGVFLDPGQTAKLAVQSEHDIKSYGNSHYLKWPTQPGEKFLWVPKTGRPVASMITLR